VKVILAVNTTGIFPLGYTGGGGGGGDATAVKKMSYTSEYSKLVYIVSVVKV
jgi:hypothetical protein